MLTTINLEADPKLRKRTFAELQPYLFAYGAGISAVSPLATCYQLSRINPLVANTPFRRMATMSAAIALPQTALKVIQMNLSTPVREYLNPWAAFAVVGVLQGGVYGQANVHFATKLGLGAVSFMGLFRGSIFAGLRDMISQGIPFVFSSDVRRMGFDPMLPAKSPTSEFVKKWGSILSTSVVATVLSQGPQNSQLMMQSNHSLSYMQTMKHLWTMNGVSALWRGAEARIILLAVVSVLNELVLKPAWEEVPNV
jgi:hypothetical protein